MHDYVETVASGAVVVGFRMAEEAADGVMVVQMMCRVEAFHSQRREVVEGTCHMGDTHGDGVAAMEAPHQRCYLPVNGFLRWEVARRRNGAEACLPTEAVGNHSLEVDPIEHWVASVDSTSHWGVPASPLDLQMGVDSMGALRIDEVEVVR